MSVILGINHQFLYPDAICDKEAHFETLKKLSQNDNVDALDCWVWRENKDEIKVLKDSNKIINYNIGDRFGEKIILPSSPDKADQDRAYDITMREIGYALELNSKKIILGSGPDSPDDRKDAIDRFREFILKIGSQLPNDVELSFEPTDRDIDKFFLFGPLDETVDFINSVRENGFKNFGLLLDMCHIPLMHETLSSALKKGISVLNHVHLGNCLLKDKTSPFYGDKHIPWDYPMSEYSESDAKDFIKSLKELGYLKDGATVSFEMRPYENITSEESLIKFKSVWEDAIK